MTCSQPYRRHQFALLGDTDHLRMAKTCSKLQAVHWIAVARGLPAIEAVIENVKLYVY